MHVYFDLRHNLKNDNQNLERKKGDKSHRRSSQSAFNYINRTSYFLNLKSNIEEIEYRASFNMPRWAENNPAYFWKSADLHEIKRGRTSSHITIALPKELSKENRIKLCETLMHEFCGQYKMPCSIAIHNHIAALDENSDQPHLHLLFSERSLLDNIERSEEQFFKQYRHKNIEKGEH